MENQQNKKGDNEMEAGLGLGYIYVLHQYSGLRFRV